MARLALLLTATLVLSALSAGPVAAAGSQPQITSPANNATFDPGYVGPITVEFGAETEYAIYELRVTGPDRYEHTEYYDWSEGASSLWTVVLPGLYGDGTYKIRVIHEGDVLDEVYVTIRAFAATITAPADESHYQAGSAVTATVRWTTVAPDTEVSTVFDGPGENKRCVAHVASSGHTTTCPSLELREGRYTIRAEIVDPATGRRTTLDRNDINVFKPLNMHGAQRSHRVFYPLVKDGYRDKVTLWWSANTSYDRTVRVLNTNGKVVRAEHLGEASKRRASNDRWTWNGRNNSGDKVNEGKYTIEVAGRDTFGNIDTVSRKVKVNTRIKVERWYNTRGGWNPSSVNATGTCGAAKYFDSFILDCWGKPGQATAKYNMKIHANAYDITWRLNIDQGCCYKGKIDKFGERLSARKYRVGITIDDWRKVYIYKARVEWKRKVKL